jgi:hypothetical protein
MYLVKGVDMENILLLLLLLLPIIISCAMLIRWFCDKNKKFDEKIKQCSDEIKKLAEKCTNENLKKAQEEYEIENYGKITDESVSSQSRLEVVLEMTETMIDMERYLDRENRNYEKALTIIVKLKRLKSKVEEAFDKVIKFELKNRHILGDYYESKEKAIEINVVTKFKTLVAELNKNLSELNERWSDCPLIEKMLK